MRYIFLLFISTYLYLQADGHIFVYHRFGDTKHGSTNTSIKELKKEFEYFKNNGYKVVPIDNFFEKLEKKEPIPDNWVALTIDDAYKSFYKNGLAVFKEYGYPFALYVYTEATEKRYGDFMTWAQIKEAQKYGGTIGLHSYSHPRLTKLTLEEVKKDTQKSYELFTKRMGYKPQSYAYPYGEYTEDIKKVIKSFGFRGILNQSTGSVHVTSDPHDIYRIALVGKVNIKEKIKYNSFDAKWIEPTSFPKNGILKHIKAKVSKDIKKLNLYITGEGWREVNVNNGEVDEKVNIYLKNSRTRIILGQGYYKIASKIIIK
jgi:peptidoglycan/xylan/chitin deacetylase (PgdA/CDA1 family)